MDDPDDQHNVIFHNMENPVTAMSETADSQSKLFLSDPRQGILTQLVERFCEPAQIGIGSVLTEFTRTIGINICKICASSRTDYDFSHAGRDVRQ